MKISRAPSHPLRCKAFAAAGVLVVFVVLATQAIGAAGEFTGTFKNDEIAIALQTSSGTATGAVTMGKQSFPLRAAEKAGALQGTFLDGSESFAFKATLDGDTLTFTCRWQ